MVDQLSILYIEDDSAVAYLVNRTLKGAGYQVDIATDGSTGIEMYQSKPYDAVIIDQNLPSMSGIDVLQKLQQSSPLKIPIIIITAVGSEHLIKQAIESGADDFIIKDIEANFVRLLPIILKKVFQQHQLHEEKIAAEIARHQADNRFKRLIENISDIICVVTSQGKIKYMSPSGYTFWGAETDNTDGLSIVHPDDQANIATTLEDVAKNPSGYSTNLVGRFKNHKGEWYWFEGTATNLLDDASIHGIVLNLHNITSLQEIRNDLEHERNTLRTLVDAIPDEITVKDDNGTIILRNKKSQELEAINKTDTQEMILEQWQSLSSELDQEVLEKHQPVINREKQIGDVWYEINKIPLQDGDGDVKGLVSIRTDITERKHYEQTILEHNAQLLGLQIASSSIATTLNVQDTILSLSKEIIKITGYQVCRISRWDKAGGAIQTILEYNSTGSIKTPDSERFSLEDYPATANVLEDWVGIQRKISDKNIDANEKRSMMQRGIKSSVMIPIIYGDSAIAIAEIEDYHEEKTLDSNELLVVELLLHQAGIALENARLYEQSRTEIAERKRAEVALRESEEKLRATLASLDDLVFTLDEDGVFLEYYRPEHTEAKLYAPPEVFIGKHYTDVLPVYISPLLDHAIESLRHTNTVQQIDYPLIQDDETLWFNAKVSLRYKADGAPSGITIVARDMTEIKNAQDDIRQKALELELSARRYQALFEQSYDAIMIMDEHANYITTNQRASELFGYSADEFQQMTFHDMVSESVKPESMRMWQRLREGDNVDIYERTFLHKDGTKFSADVLIEIVTDEQGQVLHVQTIVRDITERKTFEQSLMLQQQRLQALHIIETNPATTTQGLIDDALQIAADLLGMETGIITRIDGTICHIEYVRTNSSTNVNISQISVDATFCKLAHEQNTTIVVNDVSKTGYQLKAPNDELEIASYIGEPLVVNDENYGTIAFLSSSPKNDLFVEADKSFMRLIAQWVVSVLEHDRVERQMRESEERFRIMFEMAPIGIYLMTRDGIIQRANNAFSSLLGYTIDELKDTNSQTYLHPDDNLRDIFKQGHDESMYEIEMRFISKAGHTIYTLISATWLQTTAHDPLFLMGQVIDITERKLAETELATYIRRLELLHQIEEELTQTLEIDSVMHLAIDTAVRYSKAKYGYIALNEDNRLKVTYYIGKPDHNVQGYIIPDNTVSARVFREQTAELITNVHDDPDYYATWTDAKAQITLPLSSSGHEIGILGLETDTPDDFTKETFDFLLLISRRIASALDNSELYAQTQVQLEKLTALHSQLVHQATHDPLTKLPNRALFHERLEEALNFAKNTERMVGLIYIDLDGFKRINDTLGHPVGDQLLIEVSERLTKVVRQYDTVARMGGDEFTVILPAIGNSYTANKIAERILATLRDPFVLSEETHYISASIGISFYPNDGTDTRELLRRADTALYMSKAAGKNTFNIYDSTANRKVVESVVLGNMLHKAVEDNQLMVHYQPMIDLQTNKIIGAEALLRWNIATGMVSPSKFLPIASEVGLLVPITNWVFSEVCRQQDIWRRQGKDWQLSVNIAIPQFQQADFIHVISTLISQYDFPASSIELEMTEQLMIDDLTSAANKIERLRDIGFKIAIDDFGTGYSSLSYLQKLPIDTLKIDRSLIVDIASETHNDDSIKSIAIINAILSLASTVGVRIVAEGVETEYQRDYMRSLGVNVAQGYLISKALPADEFEQWVEDFSEQDT